RERAADAHRAGARIRLGRRLRARTGPRMVERRSLLVVAARRPWKPAGRARLHALLLLVRVRARTRVALEAGTYAGSRRVRRLCRNGAARAGSRAAMDSRPHGRHVAGA